MSNKRTSSITEQQDLLAALPKTAATDPAGERLAELIGRVEGKKVPVNSFSRIWLLGSLQGKIVFGYVAYWLRSCFRSADEKIQRKNEAHLEAALQMLATMGYLRGAIMKIGQMLATLPEIVPEQFTEVLESLHFEAPPMHYAMIREVFLDEFGREPEEVFASFERRAFAAASLGQVHRARLHSGEEVAVKIQYPDIASTIRADLRNLRTLLQPLRFREDWPHLQEKLADIEQMLLLETDYLQEADYYCQAKEMFTSDEQIVVPKVFAEYTTSRVLTTEFLPGQHLKDFLAGEPDQASRDHYCHLFLLATLRPYYRKGWYFADPHPGNFLFMADGRLGLLDFGCTRVMTESEWQLNLAAEQAYCTGDEKKMDQVIAEACLYSSAEKMPAEHLRLLKKFCYWQLEPWGRRGHFDFGDEDFYRRGISSFMELVRKGCTRGAPLYLWSNRSILGYRGLGYQLKGHADFGAIIEPERTTGMNLRLESKG